MAIGYSMIIAKYDSQYFKNWILFISNEFTFLDKNNNITIINQEGDEELADLLLLETLFLTNREVVVKFWNKDGRAIGSTLDVKTGGFVKEYYSLDELVDEKDHNTLYNSLLNRFIALSIQSKVGGFFFDKEGYMEDYVRFE